MCGTVVDKQPYRIFDILTVNANFKGSRESGRVEVMNVLINHPTHFVKVNVRVTGRSLFSQLSLDFMGIGMRVVQVYFQVMW